MRVIKRSLTTTLEMVEFLQKEKEIIVIDDSGDEEATVDCFFFDVTKLNKNTYVLRLTDKTEELLNMLVPVFQKAAEKLFPDGSAWSQEPKTIEVFETVARALITTEENEEFQINKTKR